MNEGIGVNVISTKAGTVRSGRQFFMVLVGCHMLLAGACMS